MGVTVFSCSQLLGTAIEGEIDVKGLHKAQVFLCLEELVKYFKKNTSD